MEVKENIFYCSFGKDSLASILLAHENNIKIDYIVYVEVMATNTISGENPLHVEFIKNVAIPKLNELGYEVTILHSKKTYEDLFFHKITRSKIEKRNGKINGFVLPNRCGVNDRCKIRPVNDFNKKHKNAIRYVGIAIDEPKRLKRLTGNKKSLLAELNYTEQKAKELCLKYDLLSPIYQHSMRNGCWFCPNAKIQEQSFIYKNYPELWNLLEEWNKIPNKVSDKFAWGKTLEEVTNEIKQYNMQMNIFDFIDNI